MTGRVIKSLGGKFFVDLTENGTNEGDSVQKNTMPDIAVCHGRRKIKRDADILAGDMVELAREAGEWVVERVLPRKNFLVRPPVANITRLIIVLSVLPAADLMLADKLIINAHRLGVEPIICLNKTDLTGSDELLVYLCNTYNGVVGGIKSVCAETGDVESLRQCIAGNLTCICGQSAVGKTSLLNALTGRSLEVGELAARTDRGRHTTRCSEIFPVGGGYLIDTPGFSLLSLQGIDCEDLHSYYDDYLGLAEACRYNYCNHINEPQCAVKDAVSSGKLDSARYERYLKIYTEIKEAKKW